ncbi:unnamed protein product [Pseudo-nitzschia multistriata]|uniref:Uncharacterized protein n=1 Tax=Pseudo-nitzschia multistriata TaxID=183589 RepID=A0A448YW20_9STRA|nr:unnamed protein product [Pseudo-nitzschia multistriata]
MAATNNSNDDYKPKTNPTPAPTPSGGGKDEPDEQPTQAESDMTEAIARDRPTIDAAVKSFVSLVCARSMAASGKKSNSNTSKTKKTTPSEAAASTESALASATATPADKVMMGIIPGLAGASISPPATSGDKPLSVQQRTLNMARIVLRAVNAHTFSVHDTVAYSRAEKPGTSPSKKKELLELSVVARLWNALVESEQKPSRFLGRRALKLAWGDLDLTGAEEAGGSETDREALRGLLTEFGDLLFRPPRPLPSPAEGAGSEQDDDAALLWAPDGGAGELARRRQRRLAAAEERGPRTPS